MTKRIFVGYGQGGILTSPAMVGLANRLKAYGEVSLHGWQDFGHQVVAWNNAYGGKDLICVGYSLSASMLQWIGERVRHEIALGVAIDPSKQFYLAKWNGSAYEQRAPNIKHVLCFWNPGALLFGGAVYQGNNVTVRKISLPHLAAQGSPYVWQQTEAAVKAA